MRGGMGSSWPVLGTRQARADVARCRDRAWGAFLFHKKVTRTQILALAVSYCGVLRVFGREMSLQGADVSRGAAMMAIERIGASLTAQAGTIGPVSTILMAVMLLGEPFTAWVAAGTVLVLAGIWLLTQAQPNSAAPVGS